MANERPVRDLRPGSIWLRQEHVSVVGTADRTVLFADATGGRQHALDDVAFRTRFSPIYDRARVASQFSMSTCNLGEFCIYWLARERRIIARSAACERRFAVPAGALLVGFYAAPSKLPDFFDDLDDAIRRSLALEQRERAAI